MSEDKYLFNDKSEALVKGMQKKIEELKGLLKDTPDHSEVDALVFENNLLKGKVKRLGEELKEAREIVKEYQSILDKPKGNE